MNLFVQILANRAHKVWKNTDTESNRTSGLTTASAVTDRVPGSSSSSNLDGTGETDCILVVVVGMGVTLESMVRVQVKRDAPAMKKIPTDVSILISRSKTQAGSFVWGAHRAVASTSPPFPSAPQPW